MKDLLTSWAPTIALIVGGCIYWVYGTVSAQKIQNEILRTQLLEGCSATLAAQGYEITRINDGKETDSTESKEDSSR